MTDNQTTKSAFYPTNRDPHIHEAAARLFWTLATLSGFQDTEGGVLESRGTSILIKENVDRVIRSGTFPDLADILKSPGAPAAIALEAYEHAVAETNLIGIFYQDELSGGRDYSASNTQIDRSLNVKPSISVVRDRLAHHGKLFLRTPLPSVVLVQSEPRNTIFEVETTKEALGFEYPMIMMGKTIRTIAAGVIVVTGVLSIPVPSDDWRNKWAKIIPNCQGQLGSFKAFVSDQRGKLIATPEYSYAWGQP